MKVYEFIRLWKLFQVLDMLWLRSCMMFTEQNVELSSNHPIWYGSASLSMVQGGWHTKGFMCMRGGDAGPSKLQGLGSGRARSLWPEHPALFPADPPVRPSPWTIRCAVGHASAPVSTALPSEVLPRTVGRRGVLACAVPGQAPVPWPVGWERGELRFNPRFPNPESEAFIPSILTCVTLWPSKKEK